MNIGFCTLCFISIIISSCNNRTNDNFNNRKNETAIDSIKNKNIYDSASNFIVDRIVDSTPVHYLIAEKLDSEIAVRYKTIGMAKEKIILLPNANYSDVIFPDTSIGLFKNERFITMKYYLSIDSILILPIIGVNNLLSTYIINLRSGEIIGSDIRTSLNLIWIYTIKSKLFFIVSNTPLLKDDFKKYKLTSYQLIGDKFKKIKQGSISLSNTLENNLKSEAEAVHKFTGT